MRAVGIEQCFKRAGVWMLGEACLHTTDVATGVPHSVVFGTDADDFSADAFDFDACFFPQRMLAFSIVEERTRSDQIMRGAGVFFHTLREGGMAMGKRKIRERIPPASTQSTHHRRAIRWRRRDGRDRILP